MPRISLPAIFSLLFVSLSNANSPATSELALQQASISQILSERSSKEAFDKSLAAAQKCGVSSQALLEARFLYLVDQSDDAGICALLPEFLAKKNQFNPADSAIFSLSDDWLSTVEYVEALSALSQGQHDLFKKHITEAFWLSPSQASVFAPHVERIRKNEAMKSTKVDCSLTLQPLDSKSKAKSLAELSNGKKAILLHFWSPWSRECEESMKDFATTITLLTKHQIAVISLVPDQPLDLREDASAMLAPIQHLGGTWMIDPSQNALARTLLVRNLPTVALISTDGSVFFNGSPYEDAFWSALQKTSPSLARPKSLSSDNKQ